MRAMPNEENFKNRGYVIERNFLSVHQAAVRLGIVERTVLQYIAAGKIYAELLDPDRPHSDKVVSRKSIEDFEKWRNGKRHNGPTPT